MSEIEWRFVPGLEDLFIVSNEGTIFSVRTEKVLKTRTSNGYEVLATKIGGRNGVARLFRVHRLVCEAFHENPQHRDFVNHIDCNKKNNKVCNLEWVTAKENMQHAKENNLLVSCQGTDKVNSKLTELDVLRIKNFYIPRHNIYSARRLAKLYGVEKTVIKNIIKGERWHHVPAAKQN